MKIFWFDTETTGKDPVNNDIIQISGMVEIDGEIKEEFNFQVKPFNFETIEPEALAVNGINIEDLKEYPDPKITYQHLMSVLDKYIDRFDKTDKFIVGGYNARFDIDFLNQFFLKNNNKYFGAYFKWQPLDPLALVPVLVYKGKELSDFKLVTLASHYGIEFAAHDALADIQTTREVFFRMLEDFK